MADKWDRKTNFNCNSCMYCVPKINQINDGDDFKEGRCRRNAPTLKGYPVIMTYHDWCGEHKLGSNPVRDNNENQIDLTKLTKETVVKGELVKSHLRSNPDSVLDKK